MKPLQKRKSIFVIHFSTIYSGTFVVLGNKETLTYYYNIATLVTNTVCSVLLHLFVQMCYYALIKLWDLFLHNIFLPRHVNGCPKQCYGIYLMMSDSPLLPMTHLLHMHCLFIKV